MQEKKPSNPNDLATIRDTVESIWIAIVLAFVLRAFFIEAFVIPTGSMAPRLMGEHWDLHCPNCQYEYAYGLTLRERDPRITRNRQVMPTQAQCPNCGFPFASASAEVRKDFLNAGDRVLVMKYLYSFRDPQPFDVVVFRNPQNNQENYIKRLIGLPGETIEIVHGDVFYLPAGTQYPPAQSDAKLPWTIRRKPAKAQEAMWQVVFDNDYRAAKDSSKTWDASGAKAWDLTGLNGRQFTFKGPAADEVLFKASDTAFLPTYGYNAPADELATIDTTTDIVTDLKLAMTFVPQSADASVTMQLSSFDNRFRAQVNADGSFAVRYCPSLSQDAWQTWSRPDAKLPALTAGKGHDIAFIHVDFQVQLWIDGLCVFTSTDEQYRPDFDALKKRVEQAGRPPDRQPVPAPDVRLAGGGGTFDLLHVKLMRDVFYTSMPLQGVPSVNIGSPRSPLTEYAQDLGVSGRSPGWGTMGNPIRLQENSFFVLGDNSPQSLDGRAWTQAAPSLHLWKNPQAKHTPENIEQNRTDALYQLGTVPRYNMIGKALFVYWPAGLRPPGLEMLPVVPNAGKMRLIR